MHAGCPLVRQEVVAAAAALQQHAIGASRSAEQGAAMRGGVVRSVRVLAGCPLLRQEAIASAAAAAGLQLHAISAREVQSRERQCAEVSREAAAQELSIKGNLNLKAARKLVSAGMFWRCCGDAMRCAAEDPKVDREIVLAAGSRLEMP